MSIGLYQTLTLFDHSPYESLDPILEATLVSLMWTGTALGVERDQTLMSFSAS